MAYTRNKLQELAMMCTYQYLFYLQNESRPTPAEILEGVTEESVSDNDQFIKKLFSNVIKHTAELVELANAHLKNWKFERLGYVERAILLNSLAQACYMDQPKEVVIDVAVELAKKFCDAKAYKLINGVLDKAI